MARSTVVVLHATPETIVDDVRRALALSGADRIVRDDRAKWIEIETGRRPLRPGCCTTPWQLDAVLRHLSRDPREPALLDRPLGVRVRRGATKDALAALTRGRLAEASDSPGPAAPIVGDSVSLPLLTARRGDLARFDARREGRDAILLPPLRRSRRWGLRGAVDLAVSTLGREPEEMRGAPANEVAAELLSLHAHLHPRTVALVDMTVCGAEDLRDAPSLQNLLICSADPVAADAVGARLLGLEPARLPWLQACARHGLGHADTAEIELLGEDLEALGGGVLGGSWRPRREGGSMGAIDRLVGRLHSTVVVPWADRFTSRTLWKHYERTPWGRLHRDYRKGKVEWA